MKHLPRCVRRLLWALTSLHWLMHATKANYSPLSDHNQDIDHHLQNHNNNNIGFGSLSENPFKSQENYACGRAVSNAKTRERLIRDHTFSMSPAKPKYRPLEIRMPRIIGGDETSPGEFPWTASVKLNGQPICGGSLIDHNWILTAAHCVVGYNPKNLTIRLGAYRIKDMSEAQTIDLPVSMFIVHKDYSMPRPFSNDIAMMKLIEPIEFTDFIVPICLPTEDQNGSTSPSTSGSNLVVSGSDYANRFDSSHSSGADVTRNSFESDSGGIVISTKMSDNDIANCFNRLEQNYLNSIGLGSSASVATSSDPPTPVTTTLPIPTTTARYQSSSAVHYPLFSGPGESASGSYYDSLFVFDNHANNIQNSNHKLTHLKDETPIMVSQHSKPARQHFDFPIYPGNKFTNGLGVGNLKAPQNGLNTAYNNIPGSSYYIYNSNGGPWTGKQADHSNGDLSDRREAVKLSRLPISKELLHEIQSVGQGSMPSLNLGLAHGDFVAMASDLTHGANDQGEKFTPNDHPNFDGFSENDIDYSSKYSGLSGTVVGWGWVRELDSDDHLNKGYPSITLQKVKLPILRNNVCEAWFQSQSKKITLLPSQFCAGFNTGGKDACRGDSGGPMVIEDTSDVGRYRLIGIVSAGIGCARPSLPGLYTRVASFIPWINAQMLRY